MRGMNYKKEKNREKKIVKWMKGIVWDVMVDIRKN